MCVPAIHAARSVGRALAVGDEVSLEGRKVAPLCAFTLCCPVCLPCATSNEILGYERLRVRRIVKRYVARWNVTAAKRSNPHPDKESAIRRKGNDIVRGDREPYCSMDSTAESYAQMVSSSDEFLNCREKIPRMRMLDEISIELVP